MDDFSPMMMFKIVYPPTARSHSANTVGSDPCVSVMQISHSNLDTEIPYSMWGGFYCSSSYAPVFDYRRVLSQSIADTMDREFLEDMLSLIGYQPEEQS
jgi:hypothetical protein